MSELSRKQRAVHERHEGYWRDQRGYSIRFEDCDEDACRLAAEVEALEAELAAEKARLRPAMERAWQGATQHPLRLVGIGEALDVIEREIREEKP